MPIDTVTTKTTPIRAARSIFPLAWLAPWDKVDIGNNARLTLNPI